VSDSLLSPAGRGGEKRKKEVALLLRSSAPKEGGVGDSSDWSCNLTVVCLLAAAGELQLLVAPWAISARVSSCLGDGATLFGSSEPLMIHGAYRCATDAALRMDSSSCAADELRVVDQVVLIFLSLGCIR
jgi:hypothetical protein